MPHYLAIPKRRFFPLLALGACASLACASVLGIEDADCDPELAPECGRDEASTAAGGSAAMTGAAGASRGSGATGPAASGAASVAATVAGAPGVDAPPPESLCEEYCRVLGESCVAANEQYASAAACLSVCAELEPGAPGAAQGNSVHCRLSRAELAASTGEPGNYCSSAGPGGGGTCGDDCEGFCSVMSAKCDQMGSFDQCLGECREVPDLSGPPDNLRYNTSLQSGDSLQCRLFHVTAASLDPVGHCVHAAGLAVCSPPSGPPLDLP